MKLAIKIALIALLLSLLGWWFFLMSRMLTYEEARFQRQMVRIDAVSIRGGAGEEDASRERLEASIREALEPQLTALASCLLDDGVSTAPATLHLIHVKEGATRLGVLRTTLPRPEGLDRCLAKSLGSERGSKPGFKESFEARIELVPLSEPERDSK